MTVYKDIEQRKAIAIISGDELSLICTALLKLHLALENAESEYGRLKAIECKKLWDVLLAGGDSDEQTESD